MKEEEEVGPYFRYAIQKILYPSSSEGAKRYSFLFCSAKNTHKRAKYVLRAYRYCIS
jgi:hypothetical protein